MIATIEYITSRFNYYNKHIFNNKLKSIVLKLNNRITAGGEFRFFKHGNAQHIAISKKFDFTTNELDDVLIHEMIHYWEFSNYGDTSHGWRFNKKRIEINKDYNRNVSLSGNWKLDSSKFQRWICFVETNKGRIGIIPVVSDNMKDKITKLLPLLNIVNYNWFKTSDTFFAKFRTITCRRPGFYFADQETLKHCA